VAKQPHPLDEKYDLLQCRLSLVDKKSKEYKVSVSCILCNVDFLWFFCLFCLFS